MNVLLHIPEPLAASLSDRGDLERQALEALALDAYRLGRISKAELRRSLGIASRHEVDAFLETHGVYDPVTIDEIERQVRDARRLGF